MAPREVTFPTEFLWGTSTSAYQIEGGNDNSDWWRYERAEGTRAVEVCGDACDSWHRFEEDLDLVASLGLRAYRFSVEWARVQPEEGSFSEEALARYREVLAGCHDRGIVPVVTLHHFTLPLWIANQGGFEYPAISNRLREYARVVGEDLRALIGVACTINEPNVVAVMGYLLGAFPPQVTSWERFVKVNESLRTCHVAMRDALREGPGTFPVGMTLSMQEYEALPGSEDLVRSFLDEMEDKYLRAIGDDDFVGVQCYTKITLGPDGVVTEFDGERTDMGYLFWPRSVEHTVRRAAALTNVPIIVTENGIGTSDDNQRIRYLTEALESLRRCVDEGADVRGYFQWSLLDNFEWNFGYRTQFGIVSVDRKTFERVAKPSALWYANAARNFFTTA